MPKSADAFRTISEVAEWLETPAHVLRFWESKFSQVKPVKRAGGRRYYRPTDMKLLGGIKKLLHDDGMTIKGVQKILREQGVSHVAELSQPLGDAADDVVIEHPETAKTHASPKAEPAPAPAPESAAMPQAEPETELPPPPPPEEVTEPPEPLPGPQQMDSATPQPTDAPDPETPQEQLSFSRRASDTETAPDTEAEATSNASQDAEDPLAPLPSFLKRREENDTPSTATETQDSATPDLGPRPRKIEVPDDPADTVAAEPGLLSRLSRLPTPLSLAQAKRLEPVLEELKQTLRSGRDSRG
ncbi:MerR family transcriptional regulator [Roseovarius aestuariivivens]|uniref:MerR family transcriptional regulator n=1 Tax=Roseovarius aestuariivivens TaxID=1888910 RepID=UPI001081BFAB|nr:MerR family transcriptional regulator [Roseovarius aestuariivivens]